MLVDVLTQDMINFALKYTEKLSSGYYHPNIR